MDLRLNANLRKTPKLTYSTLHPVDNKQNVELVIAVFHETTIALLKTISQKDWIFIIFLISDVLVADCQLNETMHSKCAEQCRNK